jgi:DNA-binding response OmpR family regulator
VRCAVRWTPTQRRMLAVLADGLPHGRKELHACLNDDFGPLSNIRVHIHRINRKLARVNQAVICELHRGSGIRYRHVRLLAPQRPDESGYT